MFAHQIVQVDNFAREERRLAEPLREQGDLRDQVKVGSDHGDGSEERLEVVGKVHPAQVGGVHGDEVSARGVQPDLFPLEHEPDAILKWYLQACVYIYIFLNR